MKSQLSQPDQGQLFPDLNIADWHDVRRLSWVPAHFHKIQVTASSAVQDWILENTQGRWAVCSRFDQERDVFLNRSGLAFEDPQEAMLCQLTWSGRDFNDDF